MSKIFRFILVGFLNASVNYVVFCFLIFLSLDYIYSAIISYSVATVNSYVCNKYWTFKDSCNVNLNQVSKFILTNVISMLVCVSLLDFFVGLGFNVYLSQFFAMAGALSINFIACRFFVFKDK